MYASLDVGTNTVRLLLGEARQGKIIPSSYLRSITRLGGGFTPETGLSDSAMGRTLATLVEFSEALTKTSVAAVSAVATEALRRAVNAESFLARVHAETAFDLEIIPGDLEAELSCAGVLSALDEVPEHALIFDIGGGSTEFVYVVDGQPRFWRSYPLGTVMLCEHLPGPVAQQAHIDRTLRLLDEDLVRCGIPFPLPAGTLPIGTAGTVTTLAALDLKMIDYDWRRINNHQLDTLSLQILHEQLEPLAPQERELLPGMEKGRGDLILPGLRIVESVVDFCGCPRMTVSDFGLLEGGILRAANAVS
ncbi:MAG: exopolyphosphatase [Desulfuromonas sp.]|nr:MAG: exopolyphosphatase [Desulfuromonas sp.]